jgi:hypothetical protein
MNGTSGCSLRDHHFTREEDDALKDDQSTNQILNRARKDANVGGPEVELRGHDEPWRKVKEEQKNHVGVHGAAALAHGAIEGLHFAEIHAVEMAVEGAGRLGPAAIVIGGAAGGLALGVYEWAEAHVNGEKQSAALAKDEMRVAMLTQLELPAVYKTKEIEERAQAGGAAMKMATAFAGVDKSLVAKMQLHADRGMHAARDLFASRSTLQSFLESNPKIAEAYKKDPAFRAGFDSLICAKAQAPAQFADAIQKLESRDCWYAQSNVTYRI